MDPEISDRNLQVKEVEFSPDVADFLKNLSGEIKGNEFLKGAIPDGGLTIAGDMAPYRSYQHGVPYGPSRNLGSRVYLDKEGRIGIEYVSMSVYHGHEESVRPEYHGFLDIDNPEGKIALSSPPDQVYEGESEEALDRLLNGLTVEEMKKSAEDSVKHTLWESFGREYDALLNETRSYPLVDEMYDVFDAHLSYVSNWRELMNSSAMAERAMTNYPNRADLLNKARVELNGVKTKLQEFKEEFSQLSGDGFLGTAFRDKTNEVNKSFNDLLEMRVQHIEDKVAKLPDDEAFLKKAKDQLNYLRTSRLKID